MRFAASFSTTIPDRAKWAFTTRRVVRGDVASLAPDVTFAVPGDLVLAQVIKIGQHKNIQLAEGRSSQSYIGDYVVVACGDRYAPDQFEAVAELDPEGADLIAGGGLIGRMREAHAFMSAPTRVKPLGLLCDRSGEVINVGRYALPYRTAPKGMVIIGVVGTSMNSGKTTAAASISHGLSRAGHRVATIKATGTGAFGDFNAFLDAGVRVVADFTDAGMASTYRQPIDRIERGFEALLAHASDEGADVVVVEIADGLFQTETAQLMQASVIRDMLSGVLFAAPDALSVVGGVGVLRGMGVEPFVVSGRVSCAPLAAAEAHAATGVPIATRDELRDPLRVTQLTSHFLSAPFPSAPSLSATSAVVMTGTDTGIDYSSASYVSAA